jgi:hypothetical protein
MSSVIASWQGRCVDHGRQAALVTHIEEIAAFTQACRAPPTPVKRIDTIVRGTILVDSDTVHPDSMRRPGFSTILLLEGGAATPPDRMQRLTQIGLYGVSFEPIYYTNLYRGHNHIDIVFVRAPDMPEIDGSLVSAAIGPDLLNYENPISSADAYIAKPSIHLRSSFESWLDILMNWIKIYFVEDLHYWRREDMSGYDGRPFRPLDFERRAAEWRHLKQVYADEVAVNMLDGPKQRTMREAGRRAVDLPWAWLADRLAHLELTHLTRDVRAVIPKALQPDLKISAQIAVLQAGAGFDLDYLALPFKEEIFALSSRWGPSGLHIVVDVAPPVPPRRILVRKARILDALPGRKR